MLSGGNIDMRLLSNVILREMSREGRILSLTVEIEDRRACSRRSPRWSATPAATSSKVSHNRMMSDITAKSADLGLVLEARDAGHAAEICHCLEAAGFVVKSTSQPSGTQV